MGRGIEQKERRKVGVVLAAFGAFWVLALLVILVALQEPAPEHSGQPRAAATPKPAAAPASGLARTMATATIGCVDREILSRLARFAVDGDREAHRRFATSQVLAGKCRPIEAGTTVYIDDTAVFSGLVKVRPKGEIDAYWTNIEAVSR